MEPYEVNEILFNNQVIVYLLSEILLYALLLIAFLLTVTLLKSWDFSHFTQRQFRLENRSYLVMSIVLFTLMLKMLLLPYFVYTIDSLSDLVPGAMCAAGVIKANGYGTMLLTLKIVLLFLSGLWMGINQLDMKTTEYRYMRAKSWFFFFLFVGLSVEMAWDILYFTQIQTTAPVQCCSVIFGQVGGTNSLPFGLDTFKLMVLFYLLFALLFLSVFTQNAPLSVFVAPLFLFISYYAVVYVFGTYIYELPTHKCPFCMLQDHYHYVGYLVWGFLLFGLFFVLKGAMFSYVFQEKSEHINRVALGLLSIFVLLCSGYVLIYYLKNGVFL
jgi:hypothetical protein